MERSRWARRHTDTDRFVDISRHILRFYHKKEDLGTGFVLFRHFTAASRIPSTIASAAFGTKNCLEASLIFCRSSTSERIFFISEIKMPGSRFGSSITIRRAELREIVRIHPLMAVRPVIVRNEDRGNPERGELERVEFPDARDREIGSHEREGHVFVIEIRLDVIPVREWRLEERRIGKAFHVGKFRRIPPDGEPASLS